MASSKLILPSLMLIVLVLAMTMEMSIAGDCNGSRCGCYTGRCWAYVSEKNTEDDDWWCYTQIAGATKKTGKWQQCSMDSNCSWARQCGDCNEYKGEDDKKRDSC
jgi:hypothetical protein